MPVPLAFTVLGRPASANGGGKRKDRWKAAVDVEVQACLTKSIGVPSCVPKYAAELTVKIFYFPNNGVYTDVDNGIKYTIDGMARSLVEDDKRVVRVIAERFPLKAGASLLAHPSLAPLLARAVDAARLRTPAEKKAKMKSQYAVAVKVEDYVCNKGGFW